MSKHSVSPSNFAQTHLGVAQRTVILGEIDLAKELLDDCAQRILPSFTPFIAVFKAIERGHVKQVKSALELCKKCD